MSVRVLFFDLDDTLLDTTSGMEAALAATCSLAREHCPGLAEARIREAYYAVLRDTQRRMEDRTLSFATGREVYLHRWRQILAQCGAEERAAPALADGYWENRRRNYRLFADAAEVLPLLGAYRAAVLTNGPGEIQRVKIAAVALERWIPHAIISGEVGAWKPRPEIFRHALAQMACDPDEAVMIGDSLPHDIGGATAVGIRSVWINRLERTCPAELSPDALLPDLRGLPDLLARWNGLLKPQMNTEEHR